MKKNKFALASLLTALLLLVSCTMGKKLSILSATNPFEGDPTSAIRGSKLYESNCASCHGAKGLGNGPEASSLAVKPPNIIDKSANMIAASALYGKGKLMPAFEAQLSENQVWDISNYIKSIPKNGASLDKES